MRFWPAIGIILSNAIVVLFTLGLMLPWAQVRWARYVANNTALIPNGSLDDFVGTVEKDRGAFAEAFGDVEGIDIGASVGI